MSCTLWAPLGYTPVMSWTDSYKLIAELKHVWPPFKSICIETRRFGEEYFEVTIRRLGAKTPNGDSNLTHRVAGKIGDRMLLEDRESILIGEFLNNKLKLAFEWN